MIHWLNSVKGKLSSTSTKLKMFTILMIMEVTCCQIMICPGFQVQMTVVNNTPAMGNVGNNFILLIKWALTLYCTTNCIDNIFSNLHPDLPCYSYRIIQNSNVSNHCSRTVI